MENYEKRLDSPESIKKDYDTVMSFTDDQNNTVSAGILRLWVYGFTDVTYILLWLEFPYCDGNLTPYGLTVKKYSDAEAAFLKISGVIKIFNYCKPKETRIGRL